MAAAGAVFLISQLWLAATGLQRLQVAQEVRAGHLSVAGVNGLLECIVNENVLLLGLHQKVALLANVLEEAKDADGAAVLDLPLHRIEDNVRARAADARRAVDDDWAAVGRIGRG